MALLYVIDADGRYVVDTAGRRLTVGEAEASGENVEMAFAGRDPAFGFDGAAGLVMTFDGREPDFDMEKA